MKQLLLIFLLPLCLTLAAQPCPPGGITFSSQAMIDSFSINYPDCAEITDGIIISGADITDLSSLETLIAPNQPFLSIKNNPLLASLNGLGNIHSLNSSLGIGSLLVQNNASLVSLQGLNGLTSIGGGLTVWMNDALVDLSGLDSLSSIGKSLGIHQNLALVNLKGLGNLQSVGGGVEINHNAGLQSLLGLDNLKAIDYQELYIYNCPSLTDISSLKNLKAIFDLYLSANHSLPSLAGLDSISYLGYLRIELHHSLQNLDGLANLDSVEYNVQIYYNSSLTNINGLSKLRHIGGDFIFVGASSLTSLNGLENLRAVGGGMELLILDQISDLSGLDNLETIGEKLYIQYNMNLSSLTGLEKLHSVPFLRIANNEALPSLAGLDNIDYTLLETLEIYNCPMLSVCDIDPVCHYLENGGAAFVNNNAPGCNSVPDIQASCLGLSAPENGAQSGAVGVFPNPAQDLVYIEGRPNDEWNARLYHADGGLAGWQRINGSGQMDLSALPPGLYFLELQSPGNGRIVRKVVKE
jgi:hypothetical protein